MDLSKTTLQDIDNKKSDQLLYSANQKQDNLFINNSSSNQICHESIKECHGTYDNNYITESHYQKESCNEAQSAINLKYKQLEHREMKNCYSRNSTTPVTDIDVSLTMNDLNNLEKNKINHVKCGIPNKTSKNSKLEQTSTLENVSKPQSSTCFNANISDMKIVEEQLNNNLLTNTFSTHSLHGTNKNVDAQKELQNELIRDEVAEEAETIEKIAEMIAISCKNTDENNPKSKKKLQILMSRNSTEKLWNTCGEKTASNCHFETNVSPIKINEEVTDFDKNKSLNDSTNKEMNCVTDSQNISGFRKDIETSENNEESAQCRFEEVEDKLEEMFAGIEDEQLLNTARDETHLIKKKMQESRYNCTKVNCHDNESNGKEMFVDNCFKYETITSIKSTYPTKGAKKSSTTFPNNKNNKEENLLLIEQKNSKIPKSLIYLKTMPPRRRLSIAMNSESLKFSLETTDEINNDKTTNKGLNVITSTPVESQTHKEVKNLKKDVSKSQNKNNQKNGSNNRNNKKKLEVSNKTKQSRQNIKKRRMQRLLSSENDNVAEERPLQTKDIDTKHRSPFVLVKNNGSITVVNTVTADESNEKWTRSKKNSNYVYERKTVKGCHSSTLSNRYDADTADSSWICVFCKIGPHKKGLGDLFGPYIISSDCDEYGCNKDSTENLNKPQHINYSKNSVKYNNEMLISNVQHIYGFNQERTTCSSMLGMSRISDNCYEIWIHEECAVWSPNIFVVGSRLAGLEEATWSSMRYECAYCLKQGALLCCLQRDCKTTSHIPCAREFNWLLDESKFWAYCSNHVINKFNN